ncbi:hypothetical protein RchiOBHm_Chr3g0463961 [Rosa chinensis]|uniref:Ubiquitinyl hydrolase 1 n=1 Tax=Rosa chinensis TaxID=74649 RepID=A0A2P6R9D0_ROSCH|nr:hypothetical protein RchiOBHm_Chr3g0463961 [Rosa chinensis]
MFLYVLSIVTVIVSENLISGEESRSYWLELVFIPKSRRILFMMLESGMSKAFAITISIEESIFSHICCYLCVRAHARVQYWCDLHSKLQVLSQLLKQPIIVYKRADEHTNGGGGSAFIPIEEYGTEFTPKKAVRLLLIHLSDRNHYDLLV